jgi:transcription antitermination factor NusA-like protein
VTRWTRRFDSSKKRVAEELLDPARVKGINKIWLPDGSSETIIRIAVEDQERLPAGCEQLQITLRDLIGGHVRINFE